jgi:hypothetical protein
MGRYSPVGRRGLIWFIWSVWFNQTNETDEINKRDQPVLARQTKQFETQNPVPIRRCLRSRGQLMKV